MKSILTFLFAGIIATAAAKDPGADERFRMKWGRQIAEKATDCAAIKCCRRMPCEKAGAAVQAKADDAEARFRAKWGRGTPAAEQARGAPIPAEVRMSRNDAGAAERFRLKTGRTNPTAVPANVDLVAPVCAHACCDQVHSSDE